MTIRKFVSLDDKDSRLIRRVRLVGVREIARLTACSPSLISRWLAGQTGLSLDKFNRVFAVVDGKGEGGES